MKTSRNRLKISHRFTITYASMKKALGPVLIQFFMRLLKKQRTGDKQISIKTCEKTLSRWCNPKSPLKISLIARSLKTDNVVFASH